MEFRLVYRGPLKPNGDVDEKQALRRAFHPQLRELWGRLPLKTTAKEILNPTAMLDRIPLVHSLGGFRFVPVVSEQLRLVAQFEIVFLRPEEPGSVVTQGGDIDNRLKTLFDALRMPKTPNELPAGDAPRSDESPFFCLLEDDALITSFSVTADRLLEPCSSPFEVSLLIFVRTRGTTVSWENIGLMG